MFRYSHLEPLEPEHFMSNVANRLTVQIRLIPFSGLMLRFFASLASPLPLAPRSCVPLPSASSGRRSTPKLGPSGD